ncbi:MAG: hypothetical protein QOF44_4962 [Streptomyces sp.]|nr:hypothetical protein [Streptomyces sp.]
MDDPHGASRLWVVVARASAGPEGWIEEWIREISAMKSRIGE